MSDIGRIRAAAGRLAGHARRTPLLSSPVLDGLAGRRVHVKAECLQHTGSFKFRGAFSAVTALDPEAASRGVIAFSSGNHAQGIALAAQRRRIPACIVMPSDAPEVKIRNTRAHDAEVVLYDRAAENREDVVARVNEGRGMTLVRPFDDPFVIAGQGTVGLEIAEQSALAGAGRCDVLVSCGGGGLTSGIALALAEAALELRTRPCEPEGFDDVSRSLASGRIEANERSTGSLCDAIMTESPGALTFPIMQRLSGPGIVVSELECLHAMAVAFSCLKIVVEPGGAAALAAALFHGEEIPGEEVIAVATGGNVDAAVFRRALEMFGSS